MYGDGFVYTVHSPSALAQQRYMAIPSRLQAHFFRKHTRSQLILFAKMHEAHTRLFQSFDQLHHIGLGLILHRHHPDEHLMALHLEAAFHVGAVLLLVAVMMVVGVHLVLVAMRHGHRTAALLVASIGAVGRPGSSGKQ